MVGIHPACKKELQLGLTYLPFSNLGLRIVLLEKIMDGSNDGQSDVERVMLIALAIPGIYTTPTHVNDTSSKPMNCWRCPMILERSCV